MLLMLRGALTAIILAAGFLSWGSASARILDGIPFAKIGSLSDVIEARFPRGSYLPPSSGFNGGKNQSNLPGLQTSGSFPFLNHMKTAQIWSIGGGTNAPVTPDLLDSDGYPLATITNGITTVFFVPAQVARPGRYAITWDGNGTILTGMSLSGATGSKTSGGGPGGTNRYEFLPGTDRFVIGIDTVGSPRITNMRVFHVDDEALLNAGEVFSPYFKNKQREAGIGVVRPALGWGAYGGINESNVATWAMRKPQSYVFYAGYELKPGSYAGATSLTGQAFTVGNTPDGYTLADKSWAHLLIAQSYRGTQVSFTNGSANVGWTAHGLSINSQIVFSGDISGSAGSLPANFSYDTLYYVVSVPTANTVTLSATQGGSAIVASGAGSGIVIGNPQFTMNINGTGAKRVLSQNSVYMTEGGGTRPTANTFRSLATYIYDAGLDAYLAFGGGNTVGSGGVDNGVPPELQMRMAVEIGAHIWAPMPFLTMDPVTDYVPEFISMVKNYPGASWMIPRFEPPNELWNSAAAFYGTYYANVKAAINWPGVGADHQDWYGKALSTLGQTAANIYGAGGLGTTYQVMLGVHTFSGDYLGSADVRATAAKYVAQAASAQSLTWSGGTINYTKTGACVSGATGCGGWASHVSPANYFSPSEYGTGTETTRSNAFAGVRFVASISAGTMTVSQIDTNQGNVTGTISGSVLTVTAVNSGSLLVGAMISGSNMSANRFITSFGTGVGGTGTYNLSGSESIPASQGFSVSAVLATGKTIFGRGIANGALQSGITITGGSQAAGWALSSAITLAEDTFYAGTDMTQPGLYIDSIGGAASGFNLAAVNAYFIVWKSWAAGYGINRMAPYEGSYSPDLSGNGTSPVDILRIAGKWVASSPGSPTGLQGYSYGNTPSNYSDLIAAGGEFPSLFLPTGLYPVDNIWSTMNDIYAPNPPTWKALCVYNGTPC